MKLNVRNILLFSDKSFKENNIDDKKYNLIIYSVKREQQIFGNMSFRENDFLYHKSLELINVLNNYKYEKRGTSFSIFTTQHRSLTSFDNNLQKQIFINNFIFDNEKLIKFLQQLNISTIKIDKLISLVEEKKIKKESTLEISDEDFNISGLCQIYKCKYPTLIINKIFELYYKNPELFSNLEKNNEFKVLLKK